MWMVNQLETALRRRKDSSIATLSFLHPKYEHLKIECFMVSRMQFTQPFGVFSTKCVMTGQNLGGSTMRYHKTNKKTGKGERVGINYLISGEPGLGKNRVMALLQDIQKYCSQNIQRFIKKYDLEYNALAFDYIFTVSTFKLAITEAGKRDGQGIICFVESCMFAASFLISFLFVCNITRSFVLFCFWWSTSVTIGKTGTK